jgi:hypothetical protein
MPTVNRQYQVFRTLSIRASNGTNVSTSHSSIIATSQDIAQQYIEDHKKNFTSRKNTKDCRVVLCRSTRSGIDVTLVSTVDDTVQQVKLRIWNGDERKRIDWGTERANVNFGGGEDYLSNWGYYVDFEEKGFDFAATGLRRRHDEGSSVVKMRDDGRPILKWSFVGGPVDSVRRRWSGSDWL